MLPIKLYEALPTLYSLSGITLLGGSWHWLSALGGALLTLAGVLVFNMRISSRTYVRSC